MFQKQNQQLVLDTIAGILEATQETYASHLLTLLDSTNRIFVAGVGRSKLVGNFLAMRLMHCGYEVFVVGDVVTPSITANDLLIVISGSGETKQLHSLVRVAQKLGASTALLTARNNSTLGEFADQVFQIGTEDTYRQIKGLPMGTSFELAVLCFLEALICHLIREKKLPEEELRSRHANLE